MTLPQAHEHVLKELAERIRSDFETVLPNLELRFTTYAAWIADDPAALALPTKDDIVCVTPRSSFPIQIAEGVESGCFRVAYELQDEVIDDLQRPWPAFEVEGSLLVPIPDLHAWGKACWQVNGRFRCPVVSVAPPRSRRYSRSGSSP
jgi:hypothetical protein